MTLAALTATAAVAQGEKLTIENKTSAMIIRFTLRPADGKGQKVELLNKHGLGAGKSRSVKVPTDGKTCAYRLLAEFEDDTFRDVTDKIDICETATYTIEE
jgi:hypothetical protein